MQQGGSVPPAPSSRLSPLSHEPAGFYNVDIPMDSTKDVKKKEKELKAMEPETNKREKCFIQ
ncbi:Secretory carrier-associated membrane protein 2 [Triticum urartu]|uniref:Secretory carrier-associated membrane protein 2 n=1 Tax=Triticum urartu TaxID=4572 RepID=M7ZC81_TRIUA|nr:Secretory carrier-associated membrane protein 2 [Triticum urartu]